MRTGESTNNQHIILFTQYLLPYQIKIQPARPHLTHYQTTNFRLFQTERVCRQQFQI